MHINLDQASQLLLSGSVVAIPTETVYGLAALYNNPETIKEIYRLKNRPPKNPLIMHVDRAEAIFDYIDSVPDQFSALAKSFWPGPLTLVLPANISRVPEIVRAGLKTQAFRIPSHPVALELLKKTGPLVAPSANLSGRPSSISEAHVESDFGKDFPVLSGGVCGHGVESTILAFQEERWVVGRLGAIPASAFEAILGYEPAELTATDVLICPGQLFRHYAPRAKLHLVQHFPDEGCIIGFSDRLYPEGARLIEWGVSNNPEEVLSHLYETLRWLDDEGIQEAFIDAHFPDSGLFRTLRERLQKAAKF